jgi:hypothetical protein
MQTIGRGISMYSEFPTVTTRVTVGIMILSILPPWLIVSRVIIQWNVDGQRAQYIVRRAVQTVAKGFPTRPAAENHAGSVTHLAPRQLVAPPATGCD